MNDAERRRFDALLEQVLAALPPSLHALLEEAPLIVEDAPSPALMRELDIEGDETELCGLHSGLPITDRSVHDHAELEMIHVFRSGIVAQAGGWIAGEGAVSEEIRITILHEIGHHFGLEEDDLEELGYA